MLLAGQVCCAEREIEDRVQNDGAKKEGALGPESDLDRNRDPFLTEIPSLAISGPRRTNSCGPGWMRRQFVPCELAVGSKQQRLTS